MSTSDNSNPSTDEQPLLPVRRLHNYAYCPRLSYFQWVENIFVENADTAAGDAVHRNIDNPTSVDPRKDSGWIDELGEKPRLRSLHLTSEKLRITGIADLVDQDDEGTRLVDYKRGSAKIDQDGNRIAKDYDAVQLAAHALLLEEHGITLTSASIYYAADRKHVSVDLSPRLYERTLDLIEKALRSAAESRLPPPLQNDIKCNYCSAYPICLPHESEIWSLQEFEPVEGNHQLALLLEPESGDTTMSSWDEDSEKIPPRPEHIDGEILVVQAYGSQVGQRGGEFVVTQKGEVVRKLPIHQVRSIYCYGAIQLTAQTVITCLNENIDVGYFSGAGRYIGSIRGLPASGIVARKGQYELFDKTFFRVKLAAECIRAKIRNQRVMLMRNGNPPKDVLKRLASAARNVLNASNLDEVRGIEGGAAATYFACFASMLKTDGNVAFDFTRRTKRPPTDPVNALLSLGYSVLAKEITGVCHMVGLDPFFGFFHSPGYGRPALALDLMEEFRPLIADSVAISLINRGEIDKGDFTHSTRGVSLNERGRRRFWESWFRRLDTQVKHPVFEYRMSYRRMLEVQARQMWRFARGECSSYHGFTTR